MEVFEIEKTNSRAVSCGGSQPPYGHPTIYLKIDLSDGFVCCPYCSKKFELSE